MADPFIGEIRMFGGNFAPVGWNFCDGSLLPISQYDALFALIGTFYGGDGSTTFALPDLRGRVPTHFGTGPGLPTQALGERSGTETVTLLATQIPAHTHSVSATGTGQQDSPQNAYFAVATSTQPNVVTYDVPPVSTPLVGTTGTPAGGNQPHDNMQPTLFVNYIIALEGIFPSRN